MSRQDDTEIFEKEIIALYGDIYKYLLHLGCPPTMARDFAQITMEKAWCSRKKLLTADYKKQWLFRVAHNEYMTSLRRLSRQNFYMEPDSILSGSEIEEITGDVSDLLIENENLELLQKALDQLDPKYAIPLRMRFFGEMSHREIARILGVNYSTTRTIIARALVKLKEIFLELDHEDDETEK